MEHRGRKFAFMVCSCVFVFEVILNMILYYCCRNKFVELCPNPSEVEFMKGELILKNNLKSDWLERNLSQKELAELIGVSRNTISSIETGQFSPTAKLSLILCISPDKKFEDLFYFE